MDVLDEQQCRHLVLTYARLLGVGTAEEITDLYTPDGIFQGPGDRRQGREDLIARFVERFSSRSPDKAVVHIVASTAIEADGEDRATGRSYMLEFSVSADDAPGAPLTGPSVRLWNQRFERTVDGWRLSYHESLPGVSLA